MKNRGRPSAQSLQMLDVALENQKHKYICEQCLRGFPRKKSLDTHKLIHSNVKPYACTVPGCGRRFKQSGQLKTHIRLHTGERPFICSFDLCTTSFTHANRRCPFHPDLPLQRITSSSHRSFSSSSHGKETYAIVSNQYTRDKTDMNGKRNVLGAIENQSKYTSVNDIAEKARFKVSSGASNNNHWFTKPFGNPNCHQYKTPKVDVDPRPFIENSDSNFSANLSNPHRYDYLRHQCLHTNSSKGKEKYISSQMKGECKNADHSILEESNKRLLSAVALVELQDQVVGQRNVFDPVIN